MTVAELIDKLRAFPPELRVVAVGHESGLDDIIDPRGVKLRPDVHHERYYGPHEVDDEGPERAVLIADQRSWGRMAL